MIQSEKEKWSPGSSTRRKHLSKGSALRVSRKRRPIWTAGKSVGPTRASMARPNDRSRPCSPKKNRTCSPCLETFSSYNYAERVAHMVTCVEMEAAYYSLPPGWIGRPVKVQWDELHVRILHPNTNQLLREHLHQKRGGYRFP